MKKRHQNSGDTVYNTRQNFKPQHNETILSLQYCKLNRKKKESAQEWMGELNIKAIDCKCQKYDGRLEKKFINGLNDESIIAKIIKELTVLKDTCEVMH